MNKDDAVPKYNGILLSHKKEQNCVICRDVDGPRNCHTEVRKTILMHICDFPGGSDSKASAYNVGDLGSIPG